MAKEDLNIMVERAILILDKIYKSAKPVSLSRLAAEMGLPKTTTFRILKTLEKYNYVIKDDETHLYRLGYLFFDYAQKIEKKLHLSELLTPFMKKLVDIINETVSIGILYKNSILTIKSIEGDSFTLMSVLEPLTPLHCSSMGKIFLATWPAEAIMDYYRNLEKVVYTHMTIKSAEDFLKEKEKVLREGIAFDNEEYEYGLSCMSVPIYNSRNEVVAALAVSGPTNRMKYKGTAFIQKNLREIGAEACRVTGKILK